MKKEEVKKEKEKKTYLIYMKIKNKIYNNSGKKNEPAASWSWSWSSEATILCLSWSCLLPILQL